MSQAQRTKSSPIKTPESVPPELLRRHLCLPDNAPASQRVQSLIAQTQSWFAQHAHPWATSCEVPVVAIDRHSVQLDDGQRCSSELLAKGFREAAVDSMVVFAITAGGEVDQAIAQHWEEGRPDEAMFLNAYAIAFVEHAREVSAREHAARAEERQWIMLPRYSPGYDGWDLADQAVLFHLISETDEFRSQPNPPIGLLAHGGMQPAKTTLTIHGLTPRGDLASSLDGWWQRVAAGIADQTPIASSPPATTLDVPYALPPKALRQWAANRLQIEHKANGQTIATFRFSGTTCANMGMPFEFDFSVTARHELSGDYRIEQCSAAPASGDQGHQAMCAFVDHPRSFLSTVERFNLPIGKTLDEMIQWSPDVSPAGCLCTPASQHHKWQIVLQTLHFALHNSDAGRPHEAP